MSQLKSNPKTQQAFDWLRRTAEFFVPFISQADQETVHEFLDRLMELSKQEKLSLEDVFDSVLRAEMVEAVMIRLLPKVDPKMDNPEEAIWDFVQGDRSIAEAEAINRLATESFTAQIRELSMELSSPICKDDGFASSNEKCLRGLFALAVWRNSCAEMFSPSQVRRDRAAQVRAVFLGLAEAVEPASRSYNNRPYARNTILLRSVYEECLNILSSISLSRVSGDANEDLPEIFDWIRETEDLAAKLSALEAYSNALGKFKEQYKAYLWQMLKRLFQESQAYAADRQRAFDFFAAWRESRPGRVLKSRPGRVRSEE